MNFYRLDQVPMTILGYDAMLYELSNHSTMIMRLKNERFCCFLCGL